MERKDAISMAEQIRKTLPEEERVYMDDLIKALKSKKGPEDPDDYADLLLGYAEEYEDVNEQLCCTLADYLAEEFG
ncbi:MAG: hypothetical protein J5825_06830 [Lachnospiraceae bacterium]|nr:hypothetical protein [Lachnospiraceae bacterium]